MQGRPFISDRYNEVAFHMRKSSLLKCFTLVDITLTHISCNFPFPFKIQPEGGQSPPVKPSLASPFPLAEVGTLFFSLIVSCPYNPNSYVYWMPLHSKSLFYNVQFFQHPAKKLISSFNRWGNNFTKVRSCIKGQIAISQVWFLLPHQWFQTTGMRTEKRPNRQDSLFICLCIGFLCKSFWVKVYSAKINLKNHWFYPVLPPTFFVTRYMLCLVPDWPP